MSIECQMYRHSTDSLNLFKAWVKCQLSVRCTDTQLIVQPTVSLSLSLSLCCVALHSTDCTACFFECRYIWHSSDSESEDGNLGSILTLTLTHTLTLTIVSPHMTLNWYQTDTETLWVCYQFLLSVCYQSAISLLSVSAISFCYQSAISLLSVSAISFCYQFLLSVSAISLLSVCYQSAISFCYQFLLSVSAISFCYLQFR
jgi:hypothetical protein